MHAVGGRRNISRQLFIWVEWLARLRLSACTRRDRRLRPRSGFTSMGWLGPLQFANRPDISGRRAAGAVLIRLGAARPFYCSP